MINPFNIGVANLHAELQVASENKEEHPARSFIIILRFIFLLNGLRGSIVICSY